jgi:toxin ParE1/3/4
VLPCAPGRNECLPHFAPSPRGLGGHLADRVGAEIVAAIHKLAQTPGLGHYREDLANEPLRFWAVRKYLIVYLGEKRPIEIVRILHSARNVQAILEA